MCQPLLQQQFNAWQERHWGCSHCACILYFLSHKHRLYHMYYIYISIYYLIYIYSWILTLTPPLNLMWKILKLPDSSASRDPGCRSRHFYSAKSNQHSYSARHFYSVWTLLQRPGISTLTALMPPEHSYSARHFYSVWTLLQRPGISTLTALMPLSSVHLNFERSGDWRWWRWPESSKVSITAQKKNMHHCLWQVCCNSRHIYIYVYIFILDYTMAILLYILFGNTWP